MSRQPVLEVEVALRPVLKADLWASLMQRTGVTEQGRLKDDPQALRGRQARGELAEEDRVFSFF